MPSKNIVAIGGGGFGRSLGSLEIEKYIVSLSNKKRPKICFIPTASGDSSLYKLNFYRAFSKLDCITSHIDLFSRTENLEEIVFTQDIIYVGGGNTKSMLAVWKEWGLDKILKKAYLNGTVMSGVSAGAICWFQNGITDSWASNLKMMPCLNFVKGTCCPHYDEEPERKPAVKKLLLKNKIKNIYAVDGGAALHIKDEKVFKSVIFKKNKSSYLVDIKKKSINEKSFKKTILI